MSYKNAHIKLRDINVLVDSRSSEYGDDYDIDLGDNSINAEKDQLIRINLTYFNMYNTLHSVNFRNGHFRVSLKRGCNCYCPIIRDSAITYQNYYAIHEIASDFAVKLGIVCQEITKIKFVVKDIKNTILNKFKPFLADGGFDATPGRAAIDGNHLMDITLETLDNVDHDIKELKITFEDSDLYLILGGLKSPDNETSLLVTLSDDDINVKGYFPMQRFSDNNICLRCSVAGNSFASPISIKGDNNEVNSVHYPSDILGIFNTSFEMIEYVNSNNIFSVNVKQKYLRNFKLFLTDSKNRKLVTPEPIGTAAGLQNRCGDFIKNQNTQGNLSFKALLNIELLQMARSPV
jgi:hypothetical protein